MYLWQTNWPVEKHEEEPPVKGPPFTVIDHYGSYLAHLGCLFEMMASAHHPRFAESSEDSAWCTHKFGLIWADMSVAQARPEVTIARFALLLPVKAEFFILLGSEI